MLDSFPSDGAPLQHSLNQRFQQHRQQFFFYPLLGRAVAEVYEKYASIADQASGQMGSGQSLYGMVRVVYAKSHNGYIVHAFVIGRGITENHLEGRITGGHETFPIKSLGKFSEMYEELLERIGVGWHRDTPLRPRDPDPHVSYELLCPSQDADGKETYYFVSEATEMLRASFTR